MPHDRQFAATPAETLQALEQAVRLHEKLGSVNPVARRIEFATRTSGWSWGSRWVIEIQPAGAGSIATASIVRAGSAVAEMSEGTKIRHIFDTAEKRLPKRASPSRSTLFGDTPLEAVRHKALVPADLSDKHRHLIAPILRALAEAEAASGEGDVLSEELAIARAQRTAASAGLFAARPSAWCEEEVRARIVAGRLRRDVELIGKVGNRLLIMSDRVLQGGTVRRLDESVRASVEVAGQMLQSSRPTMTRMAVGSVLPGSALLVGLAVPKTKTSDLRTASFILVHPEWRIVEPIDPDGAHEVSGLAAQINAIAVQRSSLAGAQASSVTSALSVADELAKLAILRDSGVLTEDEFATAKARLLA